MTPRDFFKAVVKVFTLFLFFNGVIPILASLFSTNIFEPSMLTIGYYIVVVVILSLLLYVMIKKSDKIVDFLHLDKGFESKEFNFSNVESKYIVEISAVIIGFYLLVSSLPYILYHGFMYFKSSIQPNTLLNLDFFDKDSFILDVLYTIFGFILISYKKKISKILTSNNH